MESDFVSNLKQIRDELHAAVLDGAECECTFSELRYSPDENTMEVSSHDHALEESIRPHVQNLSTATELPPWIVAWSKDDENKDEHETELDQYTSEYRRFAVCRFRSDQNLELQRFLRIVNPAGAILFRLPNSILKQSNMPRNEFANIVCNSAATNQWNGDGEMNRRIWLCGLMEFCANPPPDTLPIDADLRTCEVTAGGPILKESLPRCVSLVDDPGIWTLLGELFLQDVFRASRELVSALMRLCNPRLEVVSMEFREPLELERVSSGAEIAQEPNAGALTPYLDCLFTGKDIAYMVYLSENSIKKKTKEEWGDPEITHSGRRSAKWRLRTIIEKLRNQFPKVRPPKDKPEQYKI
ncbi:MAG: hypothetical protein WEB58_16005 [Planctomycetaceae bacterium]